MTLSPTWRTRIYASVAAMVALVMGVMVANDAFVLPTLCVAFTAGLIISRIHPVPVGTLLIGLAVFGYIVGNRGFAQLSLASNLPLLPAEIVLVIAGGILAVQSALERRLPMQSDLLNVLTLLWMMVSSMRLFSDLKTFGAVALRDYATVYYAAFFFLGQDAGRNERERRFIQNCLLIGCAALLVIYPLFVQLPEFFFTTLTFRGNPLVYFKGDLAGTFMAVGAVYFFVRFEQRSQTWPLVLSILLVGATIASNNRASMLGLFMATLLLAAGRRWRFAFMQLGLAVVAAISILFVTYARDRSWRDTPLYAIYEQVASLADPHGQRSYSAAEASNKGDNNLFRAVWWRVVYDETVESSPFVGLGFGHNLAERFVRTYYPDTDEFSTRSPHNILITLFARTGLIGLLPFLGLAVMIVKRTVDAARRRAESAGLWAGCCVIFVSACFGVVLEGPMGAVVFWTMLGLANAPLTSAEPTETSDEDIGQAVDRHLPNTPHPSQVSGVS